MKVGNLVKWRKAIGIVGATRWGAFDKSCYVHWSDGDSCWMDDVALEVVSEAGVRHIS